eukprot:5263807-Alexandrium_andersonii.AAC.1
MSASLVGSEMCIRDSLGTAGLCICSERFTHVAWGQAELHVLAAQLHMRCLLYTSDAADDM